ncbi:type III-B CRISPR module-associated Cmr3 family protein [Sphaerospermopsis sp. FACHB-1194]|uniref:type III-B CRISPR module-associated Cmr3 family protein n=1 Tax=Sphaerospermopsis sp. FACHB-1194 TaxID=2692862 RepID=UPI0016804503|nr:type III-B CRISPR module-associated Cmr3 family protein [Sphaerospermopsis sp. FACHB-1194]MBD2145317.1 CRISPR-associated protein [Sphaerospermopsis sp. FACHB-1194]
MFKYLISINPLGLMYGSAGAFLSPENLVGRSGAKFPPDAATLAGLMFSINKVNEKFTQQTLRDNLYVAGPFWAKSTNISTQQNFFIPIPWHKIISKKGFGEWKIENNQWKLEKNIDADKPEADYRWQTIESWNTSAKGLKTSNQSIADNPWKFGSLIHPKIQPSERCVVKSDGLFLENSAQIPDDVCLVYLSTYPIDNGWYKFGGENHIVEISCDEISPKIIKLLNQPIGKSFALITPGVWGSNRISHRQPQPEDHSFPETVQMLTDKPVPYRFRSQGTLGRGRYAVPAGSVYVLKEPINKPWWEWDEKWFPNEGYSLKKLGCGLCLPVEIEGVN